MGIFFKSGDAGPNEAQVVPAFEWALRTQPPISRAEATSLVDRKIAELWPDIAVDKPVKLGLEHAVLTTPPNADDLTTVLNTLTSNVKAQRKKAGPPGAPNWIVFIAAAVLLVVLLGFTTWVAWVADAQPKEVTSSQLKTLSTTLTTAFTTLLGAVVGIITGEAVTKKK
jgi:hypothetical protein